MQPCRDLNTAVISIRYINRRNVLSAAKIENADNCGPPVNSISAVQGEIYAYTYQPTCSTSRVQCVTEFDSHRRLYVGGCSNR